MAEELADKTEAPTPRRRLEAREKGQVARSADLTSALVLLGALLLVFHMGGGLVETLRRAIASQLAIPADRVDVREAASLLPALAGEMGWTLLPIFLGVAGVAVLANLVQVGFLFTPKKLQPNLEAVNPVKGLRRLLEGQQLVQTFMNLLKMLLVGGVAYSAIHGRIGEIVASQQMDFPAGFALAADLTYSVGLRVAALLIVLALVDYGYRRWKNEKQLMMTRQEVREEMRRMEGDPKIKQRRRQIALQAARQRIQKDVPTADVVVTNPTELAIALKYDQEAMRAPKVIAKGAGFLAARIRQIAIESGVPIIERKPLAQALYKTVKVGEEIPERFYAAVAEILAYVYDLTGRSKPSSRRPTTAAV